MYKLNAINDTPLYGAVFQLSRDDVLIGEGSTSTSGELTFTGLTPGRYHLRETYTLPGYIPNTSLYEVDIHENGSVAVDGMVVDCFVIRNYPVQAEVITGNATNITSSSAVIINNTYSGITVTISSVGVQYSSSPTMSSHLTVSGIIGSPFMVNIINLQPNTTYYYRASVITSSSALFGDIKSFRTPQQV